MNRLLILSLVVLVLFLYLFIEYDIIHPLHAKECNMETCIQPTVRDQNLTVELVNDRSQCSNKHGLLRQ